VFDKKDLEPIISEFKKLIESEINETKTPQKIINLQELHGGMVVLDKLNKSRKLIEVIHEIENIPKRGYEIFAKTEDAQKIIGPLVKKAKKERLFKLNTIERMAEAIVDLRDSELKRRQGEMSMRRKEEKPMPKENRPKDYYT
jgi:hypothetical protein